jgi:short-subunit dehydrogenase
MKIILISGGSDGLGRALAEELARVHRVIILGRNAEKTKKVALEIGCGFVVADVRNYQSLEDAVSVVIKKYGSIEVLVNNAGIYLEGPLDSNSPDRIKEVFETNTIGTILLTKIALPHMKSKGGGRIVNVISQAGLLSKAERSIYFSSKWAITGFTKSLALELIPYKISVSGFYPGSMKNSFFDKAGSSKDTADYMELVDVVKALKFIVEVPGELNVTELGIKPAWY